VFGGDPRRLRATFTEDAELYDRARPGYPAPVLDDLVELAGLGPGRRVLEIGCGTGQMTVPLAERGCDVLAVELGREMAAVARRNLAGHPSARVVVAAFEDWPLPPEPFDVVLAATSFHWVDPAVRVEKSARALRPGGALATITTHHVAGGTEEFFADAQDCYLRADPRTPPGLHLTTAEEIVEEAAAGSGAEWSGAEWSGAEWSGAAEKRAEILRSGRFGEPVFRHRTWELRYTSGQYLDVLRTYSGHRALPPDRRRELLRCIASLIDERYAGGVVKRYLSELRVARRT
jgi:SAM-dependent methyltransferase